MTVTESGQFFMIFPAGQCNFASILGKSGRILSSPADETETKLPLWESIFARHVLKNTGFRYFESTPSDFMPISALF
jgi:hypothetical protein